MTTREWMEAALYGNDERVAELLAHHPELIPAQVLSKTALDFASEAGHAKVVARLLAANVPSGGMTALHHAAAKGHDQVVALLLDARPEMVTMTTDRGVTALHLAASYKHERVFNQLLAACPGLIDAVDKSGCTVLLDAVRGGNDNLVSHILTFRPEMITVSDNQGFTALHMAVHFGHESVAERLLAAKPELIFAIARLQQTVLHIAVSGNCRAEFVAKLWRLNPQALYHRCADKNTPFGMAVLRTRSDLVELFQWSLSLDEIAHAFTNMEFRFHRMYRPIVEHQCERLLLESLNRDVGGIVFEYLGFPS